MVASGTGHPGPEAVDFDTARRASQPDTSSLKAILPEKSADMSSIADTSHVEMGPYVAVAAVASEVHASTASTRSSFVVKTWIVGWAVGSAVGSQIETPQSVDSHSVPENALSISTVDGKHQPRS